MPDNLMTIEDLCAYLQVSRTSIWRWVKSGDLPHPFKLGSQVRWSRKAILEWVDSKVVEPKSQ